MHRKNPVTKHTWLGLLLGAWIAVACGSGQSSTKAPSASHTFVFAPRVGLVFQHEMKHMEELAVTGSSFRESREWRVLWEVTVDKDSDKYLYRRRLVQLGLAVNGAPILTGREVEPRRAEVVQVMSHDGHVLNVTGTQQLTDTLATLFPQNERAIAREVFSPEALKEILVARAVDAFDDVVGKPAEVGASWTASETFGLLRGKTIRVDSELGCGGQGCLRLVRTFDVDQEQVGDLARKRVARFSMSLGMDPDAVRLVGSDVKVQDTFVVEPETCHFHDALLTQLARFDLEGPAHDRMQLALTLREQSHAEYPPPK